MKNQVASQTAIPTSGYIRPKRLAELLGVHESTIWRKVKNRTLPSPVKISERVTAFNAIEINEWLKDRAKSIYLNK